MYSQYELAWTKYFLNWKCKFCVLLIIGTQSYNVHLAFLVESASQRPRLKLLPRTVKDPPNDFVQTQRNASIFGTGKPRDGKDEDETTDRSRTTSENSQNE